MSIKTVLYEKRNNIGYVTLNRPNIHNAFDENMIESLATIFQTCHQENNIRALVITGKGDSFSAGGDLNWMKRLSQAPRHENITDAKNLSEMLNALYHFPKPTIALVNGAAFAGGIGLTACCDIAIADSRAKFCLSEVKLGLVPAVISPFVLEKIGMSYARRYFLTAETFSAFDAQKIGLVHEVVETNKLQETCDRILALLSLGGQEAQSVSKSLLCKLNNMSADDAHELTSTIIAERRASAEGQEGMSAFFEKRPAKWIVS